MLLSQVGIQFRKTKYVQYCNANTINRITYLIYFKKNSFYHSLWSIFKIKSWWSIISIFLFQQEYSVQITFRQQWNDNRLAFNDLQGRIKYLTMTDSKKVWMPDTFFRNEKNGQFHNIIQPNLYIRVFPNGDVLYSIRQVSSNILVMEYSNTLDHIKESLIIHSI